MPASPSVDRKLAADKNLSDVADAAAARTNLGVSAVESTTAPPATNTTGSVLGTSATAAHSDHTHAIGAHDHTTTAKGGLIPVTGITATGTPSASTYLDGSGAWSTPAGGGGGSPLTVQDEGGALTTAATALNFVGSGVTASGTGATKTITIPGGSTALTVQDEGGALTTAADTLNFVGSGVTATGTGTTKTVTIPGGVTIGSWQTLTLNGGGVTATGCDAPAARLEGTELVRLRGVATNFNLATPGTAVASAGGGTFTPPATVIFTLPSGLWPSARRGLRAMGTTGSVLPFYVETDGRVWSTVALGTSQFVTFDGAQFVL